MRGIDSYCELLQLARKVGIHELIDISRELLGATVRYQNVIIREVLIECNDSGVCFIRAGYVGDGDVLDKLYSEIKNTLNKSFKCVKGVSAMFINLLNKCTYLTVFIDIRSSE